MIFAGAAYTLVGILQSRERFLLPAFVSAISNFILILYLLFCRESQSASVIGLAVTYLVSWLAQFLTLAVPLWKAGEFPGLTAHLKNPDTALAVKRALPVMLGSWLIPMLTLIAKGFSSCVPTGAVAGAAIVVYENAFSVFSIAAGLLTYGICNYLFPKLSAQFSAGNAEAFSGLVGNGLFAAVALILPTSGALLLLSEEVVELLYLRGNFTAELAAVTAQGLKILSLALPAFGITEFFSRVYYSCGRVRYPAMASVTGIAVALLSCIAFLASKRISVATVALSVALGQTTAGLFLLGFGLKIFGNQRRRERIRYLLVFVGYLLSMLAMWVCRNILRQIFHFSETFRNFLVAAIVFAVGFVIYSIWMVLVRILRIPALRRIAEKNI
jgi:putative peptidoglycan lipid II flippase